MKPWFWLIAPIALALGGCDFAPRYAPPSMSLPAQFKDASPGGVALSTDETWWRSFHDRNAGRISRRRSTPQIPTLAAAIAANQAEQARAQAALAGLLPHADAIGHITANKQSAHRPLRSANQPTYFGDDLIGAQAYRTKSTSGGGRAISPPPPTRPPKPMRTRSAKPGSNCTRNWRATTSTCAASTTRPS